ncbi:MAG: YeeE/YedE thiosulfate transporter family protein [Flavobacteriales bacterium]|nr:YeeE/YedE thiosulfate transporter family protein [Flavobacteriales bacterium]
MRKIKFLFAGLLLGIIFTKSEVVSWYRIYEMFKFKSFHMFGIIGSAIITGIIIIQVIKKRRIKSINGTSILFTPKQITWKRYLFGGTIFGLGWAMTGACPGPIFTLVGNGYLSFLVVVFSALIGTFLYGYFIKKLPH